jgi:hypothetical protein
MFKYKHLLILIRFDSDSDQKREIGITKAAASVKKTV